jgi:hypothetical protein
MHSSVHVGLGSVCGYIPPLPPPFGPGNVLASMSMQEHIHTFELGERLEGTMNALRAHYRPACVQQDSVNAPARGA